MSSVVRVRPLIKSDLIAAAVLHRRVLEMEFLSRYGLAFMRTYYKAWIEAPGSIAVAAVDERGDLLGVLLGARNPATHVRAMIHRRGMQIGVQLAAYAIVHPPLAKDLIVTRGRRYARGLARLVVVPLRRPVPSSSIRAPGPTVGEVTHVLVRPDRQGLGIGRALVDAAVEMARVAGVDELVLVTPPDLAARNFYERLGWLADGKMTSRSGEAFLRYRFQLGADVSIDVDGADADGSTAISD
jgi:GNAT superfamily N-acetyltransferase